MATGLGVRGRAGSWSAPASMSAGHFVAERHDRVDARRRQAGRKPKSTPTTLAKPRAKSTTHGGVEIGSSVR